MRDALFVKRTQHPKPHPYYRFSHFELRTSHFELFSHSALRTLFSG